MKKEQDRKDAVDSIIDGAERRCQRPKQAEEQVLHYSGKHVVISTTKKSEYPFSANPIQEKHTTRTWQTQRTSPSPNTSGYIRHWLSRICTQGPKVASAEKKPRKKELTAKEKESNRF